MKAERKRKNERKKRTSKYTVFNNRNLYEAKTL